MCYTHLMKTKKQSFINGEYYHIYNRGVDKRDVFVNRKDIERFIESMREFNRIETIESLANLRKSEIGLKALSREPLVSIVAYCLNPNHFHLVLKQLVDGGISKFMQKLQGGYTSYFNIKRSRSGALFQGTFKSHFVDGEDYFNKIIAYVNKNYNIHSISKNKKDLVFASDYEYENNNFKIVSKIEGEEILEIFGGNKNFKKHCDEIVSIIKQERDEMSVFEKDNLLDRA
jgi:putative transposase